MLPIGFSFLLNANKPFTDNVSVDITFPSGLQCYRLKNYSQLESCTGSGPWGVRIDLYTFTYTGENELKAV